MTANFEISVDKKSEGFGLKLVGDFDATSVYGLINRIKKLPEDIVKISIINCPEIVPSCRTRSGIQKGVGFRFPPE